MRLSGLLSERLRSRFRLRLLLIATLIACFHSLISAATSSEPPKLRLSDSVRPVHYSVDLTIVPDQESFRGIVEIDIDIRQPQTVLWLNATELKIHAARLNISGRPINLDVLPGNRDFAGFSLPRPTSGRAVLRLEYEGRISRNSSAGVFQLKGKDEWYVYTQFESTDARRAFPCFDEPSFKVPWQLTLHVPEGDKAFSNTPEISESGAGEPGFKTVRFGETKPLPSYLIAFGVGPFDVVDAGRVGATPLRVITPRGRATEAKFAVAAIPQLLKLLEEYFGIPFPYPKLDSLVMPISNFAMENAGLITYGQSLLLSAPENDSIQRQRMCAIVAAHEMAHQWFGDLVTTAWWDDIWLNEAFATWMENKIVAEWKPAWNIDVTEVEDRLGAMALDSHVSARKVRQPITSEGDIANAFDGITYQKGAAVLQMFETWIGGESLRQGVRTYLKTHAGGNATTADFEAAVSEAAHKNIAPAFDSFLDQSGVPVVSMELQCGSNKPVLRMSQQRSLPIGSPGEKARTWRIPVCVKYASDGQVHRQCEVMADPRMQMSLSAASSCPAWVLGNDGETGYYRVDYRSDLLQKLLSGAATHLSAAERVGILGDVQSLVDTGDVPINRALALVPAFSTDPDRHVTEAALQIAKNTVRAFVPDDLRPKGAKFIRDNFGQRARELGWRSNARDDENTRLLRKALVSAVAELGQDRQLIGQAEELARDWLADHKAVENDIVPEVLRVAAEFGNRDLLDRLHEAARQERNPGVREDLLWALGSFRDRRIARSAMELLLTGEFDFRQAFRPLLFGPSAHSETRDLPFQFLKEHLDELLPKLPREVGDDFAARLPEVGRGFCDAEHRAELDAFFRDKVKNYAGGARNLALTLETIDVCIAKRRVLGPELEKADFAQSGTGR